MEGSHHPALLKLVNEATNISISELWEKVKVLDQIDTVGLSEFRRQLVTTGDANGDGLGERRELRPPAKCYRCGISGHVSSIVQ